MNLACNFCCPHHVKKKWHFFKNNRFVCRDIGGSDPERMAAPRVEEYVTELFKHSGHVKVVLDNLCLTICDQFLSGLRGAIFENLPVLFY